MQDITPEDSVVPIYLVPPTSEEQEELERLEAEEQANIQMREQRQVARLSAIQKLSAIGLTEEEIEAIIGM